MIQEKNHLFFSFFLTWKDQAGKKVLAAAKL